MADPKLREAMAEIRAICEKHDIAGCITLVSETHAEFRYQFSPSWSVVTLQPDGSVRFRAKRHEFKTKEQHKHCIDSSVGMLCHVRDLNCKSFLDMGKLLDMLGEHMEIEHEPFKDFEPHQEH